jgi:hypothetical protein
MALHWAALLATLLIAAAARAEERPRFILPVDCEPGIDCFVQNYFDVDSGPKGRDYTCGPLTYNGHTGTDFRLRSFAEMRAGATVVAAAAGRVRGTRDGEPDIGWPKDAEKRKGGKRQCGNGVSITHGNGWITRYCHLKKGSIAVRRGQTVRAGTRLGEIGYSGKTEFPHLHLTVRRNKTAVDPFTGREARNGCTRATTAKSLWDASTLARLAYRPTGLLGASLTGSRPKKKDVENGGHRLGELPHRAPVLVFWIEIFGLRKGDVETLRIYGPKDRLVAKHETKPADRNRAVVFRYIGKPRPRGLWKRGRYRGEYRLRRKSGGKSVEVLRASRTVTIR